MFAYDVVTIVATGIQAVLKERSNVTFTYERGGGDRQNGGGTTAPLLEDDGGELLWTVGTDLLPSRHGRPTADQAGDCEHPH